MNFAIFVHYKSLSVSLLNHDLNSKDDPFATTYLAKIFQRKFLSTGTLAAMTKCTSTNKSDKACSGEGSELSSGGGRG